MQQVRQTPIFRNPAAQQFDFTAEQDKASDRYDRALRGLSSDITQAIDYERENRAIRRDIIQSAYKNIGELQAQTHGEFQKKADELIKGAENFVANYKGDVDSPEFRSQFSNMMNRVKNVNSKGQKLVAMIPALASRWQKDHRIDETRAMGDFLDYIYSEEALNYNSPQQQIDEIEYNAWDTNVALKDILSKYGKEQRSIKRTYEDGSEFEESYEAPSIFSFDNQGNIVADRDQINIEEIRNADPYTFDKLTEVMSQPGAMDQWIKSNSSMTNDEMLREAVARRFEQLGESQRTTYRKDPTLLDQAKLESQRALAAQRRGDTKTPIDFNNNYNQYVEAFLKGDMAQASQAVARKDNQDLRPVQKKEYIAKVMADYDAGNINQKTRDRLLKKYDQFADDEYVLILAGNKVFPPTKEGLASSFISLTSTNFPTRDDRAALTVEELSLDDRVDRQLMSPNPIIREGGALAPDQDWEIIKEIFSNTRKAGKSEEEGQPQEQEEQSNYDPEALRSQYGY